MPNTQRPAPITAMAFYNSNGLVPAWNQASAFHGPDGRVATLPDILAARLASPVDGNAWTSYFTTASSEFLGRDRDGRKMIVVAHGNGPLGSLAGILAAYSYQFKDRGDRVRRGGRISQETFWDLLDGKFGPVAIVDVETYSSTLKYPFSSGLTPNKAMLDALLHARFGVNAMKYVLRHEAEAITERKHEAARSGWPAFDEHPAGNILCMTGSSDVSYLNDSGGPEEGFAYAHLLAISQMSLRSDAGRAPSLFCDVEPHSWNDGVRMLSLMPAFTSTPGPVHRGFELITALADPELREHLFVPCPEGSVVAGEGFHTLMRIGDTLFTQHPKAGCTMDTREPEYQASILDTAWTIPMQYRTISIRETSRFFAKYAVSEVRSAAPEGFNAYSMEDFNLTEDGNTAIGRFCFYKVSVDKTRKIPTSEKIMANTPIVLKMASMMR
jgi:hypothetical protein